jgi:hypothetical protein
MPDPQKLESFLVADVGSVTTKVGLVDFAGGEFRFVGAGAAPTLIEPPATDILTGLRNAIKQIEARMERCLLTDDGQPMTPERTEAQGVDSFVAITSAPAPLRVAVVGLSRELSLVSAARAITGTHATIEATLALDEIAGRWMRPITPATTGTSQPSAPAASQDPAVIAAEALARTNPDVVVLVGGVDGGATTALYELTNLVASIVASREENARPTLIFAGNSETRPQVAARIGQMAQLRVVDNVCPTLTRENLAPLQRELETLYSERKITWLPGMNMLTRWTPAQVLPSSRAFENVVRFLARRYGLNVLGADIGAVSTTVVTARDESYARVVRADMGIGQNLENVIAQTEIEPPTDWLPLEMPADEARLYWLNHALRPRTLPTTRDEAYLMHAAARTALAVTARESGIDVEELDLILLTGGMFAYNSNFGALALLALDALQPRGVFTLAVDTLGLAPAFGALAAVSPEAAAGVIERDGFVTLGTVIAPTSKNREGQVDLRVRVQPVDSGAINLEVQHGSIELVPLAPGQKASIEVRPVGSVDLGRTRRGVFKAQIEGGALGLIIDARGRPIVLPVDAGKRRAKIQQWYWDIGGEVSYA